jgi:Zn-dependent M28 family amino/carboxypeptidase
VLPAFLSHTTLSYMKRSFLGLLLVATFVACTGPGTVTSVEAPAIADEMLAAIDSVTIRNHLMILSADSMEGRAPGTRGEERAIRYIAGEMERIGLEPAGENGTYFQRVPLLGSRPTPRGPLTFTLPDGGEVRASFVDDFTASTDLDTEHTLTRGDLVFVGYGIDAPAYTWDDYKGIDVEGKILLMFVNDPPATTEEPTLFQGDTLTYFGRWTYKYEEARRRGARGALLIHTNEMAGYPFTVLSNGARGEQIQLASPPDNPLETKGWITERIARQLAEASGATLEQWIAEAATRDFQPRELGIGVAIDIDYQVRAFDGLNVVGRITGASRPDEAVVFTAHHDHLGVAPDGRVYNGAIDNATGVAMLLNVAEAFMASPQPPTRTVLFLSVTAEESGLLGAEHYVRNPVIPMAQTVANINLDSGNVFGRTTDIVGIGAERSEIGVLFQQAATAEGLTVTADPRPNQGLFFRSDQLAFARMGVPAVFLNTGRSFVGQPADFFNTVIAEYNQHNYHQVGDEFDPTWPMGGMIQQSRVALRVGHKMAFSNRELAWRPGEAFGR